MLSASRIASLLPFPTVSLEHHASAPQRNAFLLEADALREHPGRPPPPADAALRIDHAVPRHVVRAAAHGAPDGPRRARRAEQLGDLSVGHHETPRHPPHEAIHRARKRQRVAPRPESAGAARPSSPSPASTPPCPTT